MNNTTRANRYSRQHILAAVERVPRLEFVPPELRHKAYADSPLPIGCNQTISQPHLVVQMTLLLELRPGDRILEIGTGSGYQTAILAEVGGVEVYSVEVLPELAETARRRLQRLGYDAVRLRLGDGYLGWPDHAPYDAIIVTAAPDHLPQPLADQLAPGGRLVIPIGPAEREQTLWRFMRRPSGLRAERIEKVMFVPLARPV
jgi:protein-L-isoaspartate(D-aspartate) O-methyltransferase